jgi:hypothetical protein
LPPRHNPQKAIDYPEKAFQPDPILEQPYRVLIGTSWAANDPFVGKWKVNPSKSKLTDEMKVEAVGADRYAVTFAPGAVDTIVADGSDQPGLRGTTLAITIEGPNTWKVVRKKEGRMLITATWALSADGKTLTDDYTGYESDGSTLNLHYVYERTAGSSGFPGTWDSTSEKLDSVIELEVRPYQDDGLAFNSSVGGMTQNMKFDGQDYPDSCPNATAGSVSSARRVNERSLEVTYKFQGKITQTRQIELSTDLKTLTMSMRQAGESKPKNVLVFDRE